MTWRDDVIIYADVSTAGDLIPPSTTTAYPFLSSSGGIATGWTQYVENGAASDVNWTVNQNGQCISNALATAAQFKYYGIERFFPVTPNHRYILGLDVRTMENKAQGWFEVFVTAYAGATPIREVNGRIQIHTQSDWQKAQLFTEQFTINNGYGTGVTQVKVRIRVSYDLTDMQNWGIQFANVWFTDVDVQSQTPIQWRDIHCDVKDITIRYGRTRYLDRFEVATCSLVLYNVNGDYTYREPHPFGLRPGRYVRLRAFYNGTSYPLYWGIIDSLKDGYSLDGHAVTTIQLVDMTTLGSLVPVPSLFGDALNVGGGAYSGARINKLLALIGVTAYSGADTGQWGTQPIVSSGRTARDEMGITADSENGLLYADRLGNIIYKDRQTKTFPVEYNQVTADLVAGPHTASLPRWDSIPNKTGSPIVDPFQLETDWSASRMVNRVTLAVAGGSARQFDDTDSQKAYGIRTYQRMDLVCLENSYGTDTLPILAGEIMAGQSKPVLRINSVSFRPSGPNHVSDVWPFTLTVFPIQLVRIWYLNALTGWVYETVVYVQSVEHRISLDDWETVLVVDQPLSFVSTRMSNKGWDKGVWNTDKWDDITYG